MDNLYALYIPSELTAQQTHDCHAMVYLKNKQTSL